MSTANTWIDSFVRNGFFHFPRLLDEKTVFTARHRIDQDLAENFDPSRVVEYDNQSFCPDLRGSAEILALVEHPEVQQRLASLVAPKDLEIGTGQIAIRRAHNTAQPAAPHPHIDGIPTPDNGVPGNQLTPFTMLVGIFLSEVQSQFAGNFTVWPGSHRLLENYFRERGPLARQEGMPKIALGEPVQLQCSPGDVVLCHYQLAHGAAVNTSDNDRYAVFFRPCQHDLDGDVCPQYRQNGWTHLTKIWTGWKIGA